MEWDSIIISSLGCVCCTALIGAVLMVILGTVMKTRFGVNLTGANCYDCGKPAPRVHSPQDAYETLWGGFTCPKCGAKNDKWGRER